MDEGITQLLEAAGAGNRQASDELFECAERELRALAHREFARWRPGATLQATALVGEAYLRLYRRSDGSLPPNRRYFYAAAARVMHDVMIENARRRARRGPHEAVPDDLPARSASGVDLVELKHAICVLLDVSPRAAEVSGCGSSSDSPRTRLLRCSPFRPPP